MLGKNSIVFLFAIACLSMVVGHTALAQGTTTPTSTPTSVAPPPIPEIPSVLELPSIPTTQTSVPIDLMDYLLNLQNQTQITLPDGTVLNITIPDSVLPDQYMNITFNPKVPGANQEVTATVENTATMLAEDRIIWTVNGQIVEDRVGADTITIRTGGIGETMDIRVSVDSRSLKRRVAKETSITPAEIAILWEANTYVPPFYKGKPLPSYQSTIKLIPIPTMVVEGRRLSPDQLLYQWTRNSRVVKELSGYGKRFSLFQTGTGGQTERLKLLVTDPISGTKAERTITLEVGSPVLHLYAGTPLLGTRYERTLGRNFTLLEEEATIIGEPYFFSKEELGSGVSNVHWTQNGKSVGSSNRSIIVRNETEESGKSRIEASITNPKRILQNAQAGVLIDFEKT